MTEPKKSLTFDELRRENEARCNESFYDVFSRSPNDWAAALAEEVGEVARICKRVRDGEFKVDECGKIIAYELADVIMYADLLAARFGIDLGWAVAAKFNHISERRVKSPRRLPEHGWYRTTEPERENPPGVIDAEYP
jgi:NTP pyrophosphatase (non-canonical NTP hydrolase)